MSWVKCAVGQDSHRFEEENTQKELVLGGTVIPGCPGLAANSDGDVILHAITNCISGITGVNILGKIADDMCKQGIKDSKIYLKRAVEDLPFGCKIEHLSLTVEAARPKLAPHIEEIKNSIGKLLGISPDCIGLTATTGEGLTAFGQGLGISVFGILTVAGTKEK